MGWLVSCPKIFMGLALVHFQKYWLLSIFSNFYCRFLNPNYFFSIWILIVLIRSEKPPGTSQKASCYQKLFWSFTVWINFSSDLKKFANSWLSALNFKSFSQSPEHFFLTVDQNNFDNKISFLLGWKKLKLTLEMLRQVFSQVLVCFHTPYYYPLLWKSKYYFCSQIFLLFDGNMFSGMKVS